MDRTMSMLLQATLLDAAPALASPPFTSARAPAAHNAAATNAAAINTVVFFISCCLLAHFTLAEIYNGCSHAPRLHGRKRHHSVSAGGVRRHAPLHGRPVWQRVFGASPRPAGARRRGARPRKRGPIAGLPRRGNYFYQRWHG